MRILFLVLSVFIYSVVFSQTPTGYTKISAKYNWISGAFDSTLRPPYGATVSLRGTTNNNYGSLFYRTTDSTVYYYTGFQWLPVGGMVDSLIYSTRAWRQKGIDSTNAAIALKLNISDTANKWLRTIYRSHDSVFVCKSGSCTFAYKDSVGSGGSGAFGSISGNVTDQTNLYDTLNKRQKNLNWVNVKTDFGAVGNGSTDDRAAIQAAIDYIASAGGGVVYFPNGIYYTGTSTPAKGGQIVIPLSGYTTPTANTSIKLLGESFTPENFDPLFAGSPARYPSTKGVIIKSGIPVGTTGSVITAYGAGGGSWGDLNFTNLEMENICVRVNGTGATGAVAAAKDTAINGYNLATMQLNHVFVDVNCANDSLLQPASTSVGIITPPTNNWVRNIYNDVWSIGQYKGIIAYEHANFINTFFDGCYYGLVLPGSNHSVHGDRIGFWRTKTAIKIDSTLAGGISIDQYNNERYAGAKWFTFVADLYEQNPGSTSGYIKHFIVGTPTAFTKANPTGSRVFTSGLAGTLTTWSSANRPSVADSGALALNSDLANLEYYIPGTGFKEVASVGQARNFYVSGAHKIGIGGNPNADAFLFSIYDSTLGAQNLLSLYSDASFPTIKINADKAAGAGAPNMVWQKNGTSKWQIGMNGAATTDNDLYVYDNANAKFKLKFDAGNVYIGASAASAPALTVYDAGYSQGRWKARVGSTTSSGTPTINTDNYDVYKITAQAAAITSFSTNLSGTPNDGDILEIQITDDGTARAIAWGTSFASSSITLPTTTVISTTLTTILQYHTTSSYGNNKWICVNTY